MEGSIEIVEEVEKEQFNESIGMDETEVTVSDIKQGISSAEEISTELDSDIKVPLEEIKVPEEEPVLELEKVVESVKELSQEEIVESDNVSQSIIVNKPGSPKEEFEKKIKIVSDEYSNEIDDESEILEPIKTETYSDPTINIEMKELLGVQEEKMEIETEVETAPLEHIVKETKDSESVSLVQENEDKGVELEILCQSTEIKEEIILLDTLSEGIEVVKDIPKPVILSETIKEEKFNEISLEPVKPEPVKSEPVKVCGVESSNEEKEINYNPVKKIVGLPDGYSDSSLSLSSEPQSSAPPFESSCSSQENNFNNTGIDFGNTMGTPVAWRSTEDTVTIEPVEPMDTSNVCLPPEQPKEILSTSATPVIALNENTEVAVSELPPSNLNVPLGIGPGFPPIPLPGIPEKFSTNDNQPGIQGDLSIQQPEPPPVPTPRKRGRPRKQVLPATCPAPTFTPNVPDVTIVGEVTRTTRSERRLAKKKKFDEEARAGSAAENDTPKKRFVPKPPIRKKKNRRSTYTKKKQTSSRKRHAEVENIQNFEEETRMSATETPGNNWKLGAMGDESQSSVTEGHTRVINKKGRIEVSTEGCKPLTVSQIVEYYWPPPATLPHGEKPEALMIQEQISEYLGVKSFKRKYPSIKRRPVEMEERNYLQENGFVSENMCDMGLTSVYAADIVEIMYNDFPQKFDEYRKYSREKKAREQRALREKQAAERADIDPKKEAVESAFSWNSEFNKTRRFKVLHMNEKERYFTDGTPCPPFERVLISHAPNNSALCVENDYWCMSLFSYECEISGNTKLDLMRQYSNCNKWMFLVGSNRNVM